MPVGTDVTERLGVRKHEKPVPVGMAGDPVGPFPSFIPKTDEENFQRVPELVARMVEGWCASIKHDGTSCTAWVDAAHNSGMASKAAAARDMCMGRFQQGSDTESASVFDAGRAGKMPMAMPATCRHALCSRGRRAGARIRSA